MSELLGQDECALLLRSLTCSLVPEAPVPYGEHVAADFSRMSWATLLTRDNQLRELAEAASIFFGRESMPPSPSSQVFAFCQCLWDAWQEGDHTLTLHTSGSTGFPKACRHTEAELCAEVESAAGCVRARFTPFSRHMFGCTFGLLLPRYCAVPTVHLPPFPPTILAELRRGDVLIAVPFVLSLVLELAVHKAHSLAGIGIVSATARMPTKVFRGLRDSGAHVLEIYGSTELGAIAARTTEDAPFTLLPHLKRGETTESVQRSTDNAPLPLADNVAWIDARKLHVLDRKDDCVQIGGVNVFPERIAHKLAQCKGVARCTVRRMRPDEGYRLKAFIVPTGEVDAGELSTQLRAYAAVTLTPPERPGKYTIGTTLPRNSMGKLTDWP